MALRTRKAQALLAYCALHPGQAQRREKLATLLWGETGETKARTSLRQTLFLLRSALGESQSRIVSIGREAISAEPRGIEVDALTFARLSRERTHESLERAAALYHGDLLDGLIVDEEPFEEWLMQERERLRELAMETLAWLLQHQRAQRLTKDAIRTARRLLALDPLQEAVHRVLMGLLFASGSRDEALRQYEICRADLKRELNLEPEAATRQLRDAIVAGRLGQPGLLGRASDLVSNGQPEREIAGLSAAARPGKAGSACALPCPSHAARISGLNGAYSALRVRVEQGIERARWIMKERTEQQLLLHRAIDENIMICKNLVSGSALKFRERGPRFSGF